MVFTTTAMNPDALGEAGEQLWKEIEPILDELLIELKTRGKIRDTVFLKNEKEHIKNITMNLTNLGINHNWVMQLMDTEEKCQKIIEINKEFSFEESKLVNLYIQLTVLSCIQHVELFKLLLLFHLKDIDPKVSSFSRTMSVEAPNAWNKLKPYVDSKFRNSLGHGTWAVEEKKVVLFEDSTLIPYERLELADFIIKVKNQNILYACLHNLLTKKVNEKFFI